MAVPKRKTSKSRRNRRRAQAKVPAPNVPGLQKVRAPGSRSQRFFCTNCNQPKTPHAICGNCGYYRGRALIEVER